ncbi:hypothetical protein EMGBS3_11640 [Anaerolineaceae bacterium]|nr:hypothetical protein EMGBS3_11640 [Anaerolineaceae bacterium]
MRALNRILFAVLCIALAIAIAAFVAARQKPAIARNLTPVAISPAAVESLIRKPTLCSKPWMLPNSLVLHKQ